MLRQTLTPKAILEVPYLSPQPRLLQDPGSSLKVVQRASRFA
jgi:hypothetical protein